MEVRIIFGERWLLALVRLLANGGEQPFRDRRSEVSLASSSLPQYYFRGPISGCPRLRIPATGRRWLLVQNSIVPKSGVLPSRLADLRERFALETNQARPAPIQNRRPSDSRRRPVVLSEDTRHPGGAAGGHCAPRQPQLGARLKVRLKIGGHIVRAVAAAPGRATLADGEEDGDEGAICREYFGNCRLV